MASSPSLTRQRPTRSRDGRGAIVHGAGALAKKDLNNFQPRLGVAWNFSDKWVFRGNFGVITSDLLTNTLNNNFEEYLATANIQAPVGDPRPAFRLSQGPPPFQFNINPDGSVPFIGTNYGSATQLGSIPACGCPMS